MTCKYCYKGQIYTNNTVMLCPYCCGDYNGKARKAGEQEVKLSEG